MGRQQQIDRYVRGHMDSGEREAFEQELATDQALMQKVQATREALLLLRTAAVQRVALAELEKHYKGVPYDIPVTPLRPERTRRLAFWSAAASCIALLLYFSLAPVHLTPIEDDLLLIRGTETTAGTSSIYALLLEGQEALQNKNYLGAAQRFESVLRADDLRDYYRQAAQWHLVLAYRHSGQPRKARIVMRELSDQDHQEYPIDFIERWKLYVQVYAFGWLP